MFGIPVWIIQLVGPAVLKVIADAILKRRQRRFPLRRDKTK